MKQPSKIYPINKTEYCYVQGDQKGRTIIYVMEIDLHKFLFAIPMDVMKEVVKDHG